MLAEKGVESAFKEYYSVEPRWYLHLTDKEPEALLED